LSYCSGPDPLEDVLELAGDVVISESQHTIAVVFELAGARLIVVHRLIVGRSIHLHYEPNRGTDEVEDERADGILSPKPQAG